jgi:hypothetical protein
MDDKDLKINKILYGKQTYGNSIDTEFSHYLSNNIIDLNKFFQDYENYFFFIPKQGEINSHQYLVSRSQEYLRSQFPLDITDFYNNKLNKQLLKNNTGQNGTNSWVIQEGILKSKKFDIPSLRAGGYPQDALGYASLGYLSPINFASEHKKYEGEIINSEDQYFTYLAGPDFNDDSIITKAYQDFNLSDIKDEVLGISLEDIVSKNITEVIINGETKTIKKVYPELFAWFITDAIAHFVDNHTYRHPNPNGGGTVDDARTRSSYNLTDGNGPIQSQVFRFFTDDETWLVLNFLDENNNLIEYFGIKNPSAEGLPTTNFPEYYDLRSFYISQGNSDKVDGIPDSKPYSGIPPMNGGYIADYRPEVTSLVVYNGIGGCPLPSYGNTELINGFKLSNTISHNGSFNMSNHFHDIPSNTKTIRVEVVFKRRGDYKDIRVDNGNETGFNSPNSGRCSAYMSNIYFGLNIMFEGDERDKIYYKPNKIYPVCESKYFEKDIAEEDVDGLTQINNINYISVNGFINNSNTSIFGQSMANILATSGSSNPQPTFNGNNSLSNPQPTFNGNSGSSNPQTFGFTIF